MLPYFSLDVILELLNYNRVIKAHYMCVTQDLKTFKGVSYTKWVHCDAVLTDRSVSTQACPLTAHRPRAVEEGYDGYNTVINIRKAL